MAIDTHCHLTLRFDRDEVPGVLSDACHAGVDGVILIGYCPMHNGKVREILDSIGTGGAGLPALAGTAGIHPHEADKFGTKEVDGLRSHLDKPDIVAIGETGLDFFREYADRSNQENLFRSQVKLASESGYPLVIHSRDAFDRTMDILSEFALPSPPGVFHCFGYGPAEIEKVVAMGFFVSFAGMLTYPQSTEIQEACAKAPIDRILVETDSPFQVPHKAKNRKVSRNEPQYVIETARKAAELRNMEFEDFKKLIKSNTFRCFPKLQGIPSWAAMDCSKRTEVSI